jgi:hypothetical protein
MKNQTAIQERYLRDPLSIRLGGLAANLARVESFSDHLDHGEVVEHLVDESKYFIEWMAPEANLQLQVELVELQRQLAQWQCEWKGIWADPIKRATVAEQAGAWSKKVLDRSGLLSQRNV